MMRDVVKKFYKDMLICILVIENQTNIDYHMVLRTLLEEGMEYNRQWNELRKKHQNAGDLKAGSEFTSGMKKGEKFYPVVTLVAYYGAERWDAAKSLHEMLNFGKYEKELSQLVTDYKIHVFDYHEYDEFGMFQTELRQVFSLLKCAQNKQSLKKLLAENKEDYYNIDMETCELLETLTRNKINRKRMTQTGEGGYTMEGPGILDKILAEERAEERKLLLLSKTMKKRTIGKSAEEIADDLMEDVSDIRKICELIEENPDKTPEELLEMRKLEFV